MRLRHIVLLSGVILAGSVLAASSSAAISPSRGAVTATVTDLDSNRAPTGRSRLATSGRKDRSLQASGCREIDIAKDGNSFLFNTLVYRWHHFKRWCWSNGRITGVWSSAYATNMDANWYYRRLAASTGYFYGNNQSGHYSFREAEMENCVLKYGCIGSEYPWVKIWVHGDGSYSWQRGS
jgi:hypothetical protein